MKRAQTFLVNCPEGWDTDIFYFNGIKELVIVRLAHGSSSEIPKIIVGANDDNPKEGDWEIYPTNDGYNIREYSGGNSVKGKKIIFSSSDKLPNHLNEESIKAIVEYQNMFGVMPVYEYKEECDMISEISAGETKSDTQANLKPSRHLDIAIVEKLPERNEFGYFKCGDCNKFYLCTTCGSQCGSEGHWVEQDPAKSKPSLLDEYKQWVNDNYAGMTIFTVNQTIEAFKKSK